LLVLLNWGLLSYQEGEQHRRQPSQLVADLPQEFLPPLDWLLVLDALRGETVHHAQDGPPLLRLGRARDMICNQAERR